MFFFTLLAHPKPTHAEYGTIDGAYVACWVNESVEAEAEQMARDAIEALGWDVEEREDGFPVSLEDYEPNSPSRAMYEQATLDGIVLNFHRWPVGAPDED
jgi:hypothetical protein